LSLVTSYKAGNTVNSVQLFIYLFIYLFMYTMTYKPVANYNNMSKEIG